MKNHLSFFALLFVSTAAWAGIQPAARSTLSNDTFAAYQWALKSEGQKVLRDITDIQSQTVMSLPGHSADVDLDPVHWNQTQKKDLIVALLDSGVEVQHADLSQSLFHNSAECVNGTIPFKPTEDKDGNGYAGDCIGWNFTVPAGSTMQNNPDDDLGHGTHVAGILAAQINNQQGVSGISNHIRILPLKVTSAADNSTTGNSTAASTALTDRVIKALRYAMMMKADVINISMGWPAATDTPELRQTFQQAIQSGITIVAAAGNNNNDSFNFPCSYEGVLCVAATGIDNRLMNFSNFGGQVDLSAPGEEIVSTFPTSLTPMGFSVKGYESLSGTSQAAPFVSGAVALLKGNIPGISEDEIKARLFLAAQDLTPTSSSAGKFIQFGTVKIQKALALKPQAVLAPDFKNLQRVTFDLQQPEVRFSLPIKNFWIAQSQVQVQIESLSSGLTLTAGTQSTLNFSAGQTQTLSLSGRILDEGSDSSVKIRVRIQSPGGFARSFVHQFQLSRSLASDPQVQRIGFNLASGSSAATALRSLLTVSDPLDLSSNPDYYWSELKSDLLQVHVLQLSTQNRAFQESPVPVHAQSLSLLNMTHVPLSDGRSGYWIGTVGNSDDGKSKVIRYSLLNQNLSSTGAASTVEFTPETIVIDKDGMTSLHFAKKSLSDGEVSTIPVFTTTGKIPKADVNPDPFQFEANNSAKRVFYLEPVLQNSKWIYKTRNFDNSAFQQSLRSSLGLTYQDDLNLIGLLPQSKTDFDNIRILYSYGSLGLQNFAVVETHGDWLDQHRYQVTRATYNSSFLGHGVMSPVMDLAPAVPLKNASASFAVFLTPIKAENIFLQDQAAQIGEDFTLQSSTPQDLLISFVQSYQRGSEFFTFAQSKSNLILQMNSASGQSLRQESSIHRATWPGLDSTELLYPAFVRSSQGWSPSIYVDATQMYSNNIYFWVVNNQDQLVAPAKLNIDVPLGCRALTPQRFSGSLPSYGAVLLCPGSANSSLEMQILPLNL